MTATVLTDEAFRSPDARYRGAPLWSWNARLDWPHLKEQIDDFERMGFGGFHMHTRIGMDTPYLGDEYMDIVAKCVEYAKEKGLAACLYDEDRWPSGAAGGLALKEHPEYRAKHLLITPRPYGSASELSSKASAKATRSENGVLLARIELVPASVGQVTYHHVPANSDAPPTPLTRYVYLESNPPSPWYNGETYLDLLNPKAVTQFITSTHDVYKTKVGGEFGGAVPTMFTDEPQHSHRSLLSHAFDGQDVFLPWTDDLADTFASATGQDDLVERIAELVWDIDGAKDAVGRRRWEFADHLAERFVTASLDQMATWCRKSGLKLTGHLMNEPTLLSQTIAVGETMRAYRNMDIPGVDMLCERVELNSVKQASSVARQQQGGPAWTASEIYGVTNWTMTFEKHKLLGDWQAALGINWRVHHLSPVSLWGEAKRDYPAAIAYQSPWHAEYPYIENHFARVNLALTTGTARTRVAVIHPIESFWLCFGPAQSNMAEMVARDTMFKELTDWLLFGLIDFDFIAESLLPTQADATVTSPLHVGHCSYDVVIVPNLRTIRQTTLDILNRFSQSGGRVLIAGDAPSLVDAQATQSGVHLQGEHVDFNRFHILDKLESHRDVRVVNKHAVSSKTLLHQVRDTEDGRIVFFSNLDRLESLCGSLSLRGEYSVDVLDTVAGSTWTIDSIVREGWTCFDYTFQPAGSLLVRCSPRRAASSQPQLDHRLDYDPVGSLSLDSVHLTEPNVLLLDHARFRVDGGKWEEQTEVLRIGNIVRQRMGMPIIGEAAAQTWTISADERKPRCSLTLDFDFESLVDIDTPVDLAIELAEGFVITLNGHAVPAIRMGWWVDKSISRVRLANSLPRGKHSGLPFYAGNIEYRTSITVNSKHPVVVQIPHFQTPVITVTLPDLDIKETIAVAPFVADLGSLPMGRHQVVITCFGNRENSFGLLHLAPGSTQWCSPNEWRVSGDEWIDEYDVKPMGIMGAPRVLVKRDSRRKAGPVLKRDRPLHVVLADPVGGPILGPRKL